MSKYIYSITSSSYVMCSWVVLAAIILHLIAPTVRAETKDGLAPITAFSDACRAAKTMSFDMNWKMAMEIGDQNHESVCNVSVVAEKPNKLSIVVSTGDGMNMHIKTDGTQFISYYPQLKQYIVAEAPKTFDHIEELGTVAGIMSIALPFLTANPKSRLMEDVTATRFIGNEDLDGTPVQHVQLTQEDGVIHLLFGKGETPMPLKIVYQYSDQSGAERVEAELRFSNWKLDSKISADTFLFTPPSGTEKIEPPSYVDVCSGYHTYEKQPIPCDTNQYSNAAYQNDRKIWYTRMLVEGYEKNGSHNPKWDAQVIAFLGKLSDYIENTNCSKEMKAKLYEESVKLREAGCDDPLIAYYHGNLTQFGKNAAASEPLVRKSLIALEKSSYSRFQCYFAATCLWTIRIQQNNHSDEERLTQRARDHLASAAADPVVIRDNPRYYLDTVTRACAEMNIEEMESFVSKIQQTEDPNPWVMAMLEGRLWKRRAWKERGRGWAYRVSDEDFKGFAEGLETASGFLEKAYALHPEYPEAATEMISIAMGSCGTESEREWFDRAVAAQMDYTQAYNGLLGALVPRWGGSYQEMLSLGEEGIATERYDTDAPWAYLRALHRVARDHLENWKDAFCMPGVLENVSTVFDHYSERFPERKDYYNSILAVAAWAAKEPALSMKLLEELGDEFDGSWFADFDLDYGVMVAELAAATGDLGNDAKEAERLYSEGKTAAAAPLYLNLLRRATSRDRQLFAYNRIAKTPIPGTINQAIPVIDSLGQIGVRYKIIRNSPIGIVWGDNDSMPEELHTSLTNALGPDAEVFMSIQGNSRSEYHRNQLSAAEVERLLATISNTLHRVLKTRGLGDKPEKGSLLETHANLVEIDVLLRQDMGNKAKYPAFAEHTKKKILPRLREVSHRGWAIEEVTGYSSNRYAAYYMKWYIVNLCNMHVQRPADHNTGRIRAILASLESIEDEHELADECWMHYWKYGGCRLPLEMAQLLRRRGLNYEAFLFEEKVAAWITSLTQCQNNSSWSTWAAMCTYGWVAGYEDLVCEYANRSLVAKKLDSCYYVASAAMLRKGDLDKAVRYLLDAKGAKVDTDGPFTTPEEGYKTTRALREAIIAKLLDSDQVSDQQKQEIRQTFPPKQ